MKEKLEKILKELPEDVRKDVLKKNISLQDGIKISKISDLELRKEATKIIKRQEETKKYVIKEGIAIASGKKEPEKRMVKSPEERLLHQFAQIHKQVMTKMHLRVVNSYDKKTREALTEHMKSILYFLMEEFKNDDSIEAKIKFLPNNIIDIN